jgi:hypothetical protein
MASTATLEEGTKVKLKGGWLPSPQGSDSGTAALGSGPVMPVAAARGYPGLPSALASGLQPVRLGGMTSPPPADQRPASAYPDAVARELRRAPRRLSPQIAVEIGVLIGPLDVGNHEGIQGRVDTA